MAADDEEEGRVEVEERPKANGGGGGGPISCEAGLEDEEAIGG